ncbi:hypothetical protein Tco_0055041 [Tanacetum coccineum]
MASWLQSDVVMIERFENSILKQREEINNRMTEMFRLLKELTTSKAPEKVLMREEAKHPVTKNVNYISLIIGEEEKNDDDDVTISDSIKEHDGLDAGMPLKEAERRMKLKMNQSKVLRRNSHKLRKKKQWRHIALSL